MPIVKVDKIKRAADDEPMARSRAHSPQIDGNGHPWSERQDLLRRFTCTPHAIDLQLMQRTVRVETNEKKILDLGRQFFRAHQHGSRRTPQFLWRIVCESDPHLPSTAVTLSAFSDFGLRYVNIGQRSFLSVDLESREAVAFLSDRFLEDVPRFRNRPPLDILFCMTASSLGLTPLSGACVGVKDRAVLIFGPPNSGKTTASYLAARLGREFHADQVVFLDTDRKVLQVWGDPFPAVFRPQTLQFLPELRLAARRSAYSDLSFYYFDKSPFQSRWARAVEPVCGIFLERAVGGETELRKISSEEALSRLKNCLLFGEDARFDEQINTALSLLAANAMYDLRYDNDPKIAATVIQEMLR